MSHVTSFRLPHARRLSLRGSLPEGLPPVRVIARELTLTAVVMLGYFLLRGIRPDNVESSVDRSLAIIRFEQQIGVFQEVAWQQAFLNYSWLMQVANWIYAWGHYPVLLAIGAYLLFTDTARFRFLRNVMIVSAVVGVVSYWLFPAAPPRLMEANGWDYGIHDTVFAATSSAPYFQPGPFVNEYAALPSFHFGWIALASAALWMISARRTVRIFAVIMSALMWWAVTVTGNHYFFDMVMGALVVAGSWLVVAWLSEWRARRPAAAPER